MNRYWNIQFRKGNGPVAVAGPEGGVGAPGVPASPVVPTHSRQDIQGRRVAAALLDIALGIVVLAVWCGR